MFLTDNEIAYGLAEWLISQGHETIVKGGTITLSDVKTICPELIISYNYKSIIKKDIIDFVNGNIINLHISYLPWNRGVSPNIFSFLENTKKGVTIHFIDEGLDTGDIIAQKEVELSAEETLASTYEKLNYEIQQLFKITFESYYNWNNMRRPQDEGGSKHTINDYKKILPLIDNWNMKVKDLTAKYNK